MTKEKKIYKKLGSFGVTAILLAAMLLVITPSVTADNTNYIGFDPKPKQTTIGESFEVALWADIYQSIETISIENCSFLPAGIINYTSAEQGDLFAGSTGQAYPEENDGWVSNESGWFKGLLWSYGSGDANNTNATAWNITWLAYDVGEATITVTDEILALDGDPTTVVDYTGIVEVHPQDPSGLTLTAGADWHNLSWSKEPGMDKTVIRWSKTAYPTTVTEGTLLTNTTDEYFNHTSLDIEDDYYYSAWGWNETEGWYSLTYQNVLHESENELPSIFNVDTTNKTIIDLSWTGTTTGKEILRPNDVGESAEWGNIGGETNNWQSVDEETSDGDTTYIRADISDSWDSYNIEDFTAEYPISSITVYGQIKADNSETCKLTIYDGTTTYESNDITPGSSYGLESNTWATNPATSSAWTGSEINDLEIGIKYTGSQVDRVYCTQMYLEVEYDLPTFVIERSESPGPWAQGAGTEIYNDTGVSFSDTGLTPDTNYYYQLWTYDGTATDNKFSENYLSGNNHTTDNTNVSFSNEDPTDTATGIDKNYDEVSVDIADGDGDSFDYTIEGTYLTDASGNGVTDGTYTATLDAELPYDTVITWYVNATDGHDWTREVYTFTVRSEFEPSAPTGFTATQTDRFTMDLSWTAEDDYTYIEYSESPGSWARGDGTFLANITGESYTHTGLVEGTTYYYQAWSYNDTDWVYSAANASDFETTVDDQQPIFSGEDPVNTTVDVDKTNSSVSVYIADPEGDDMVWNITVTGDNGFYATAEGVETANGTISCALTTPLTYDETLTWTVTVTDRNETGTEMETTVEEYWFTVRSEYKPAEPTGFTATTFNRTQIDLSWTKVTHGEKVMIERNTVETWVLGSGTQIYNDTGTAFNDLGTDLPAGRLENDTTYYYQAWSWNVTDAVYSDTYAEANDTTNANEITSAPTAVNIHDNNYTSVYNAYMAATVTDPEGDELTVQIVWGNNHTVIYTNEAVTSGSEVNISLADYMDPDWLDHNTHYEWYILVDDTFEVYNSSAELGYNYWFNTSYAWDTNEDRTVDGTDVSAVVGHYQFTGYDPSVTYDINNDEAIDGADVSFVVGHYQETYPTGTHP